MSKQIRTRPARGVSLQKRGTTVDRSRHTPVCGGPFGTIAMLWFPPLWLLCWMVVLTWCLLELVFLEQLLVLEPSNLVPEKTPYNNNQQHPESSIKSHTSRFVPTLSAANTSQPPTTTTTNTRGDYSQPEFVPTHRSIHLKPQEGTQSRNNTTVATTTMHEKSNSSNLAIDHIHATEFPYALSCPGQVLHPRQNNYTIVLGYHVGMLRNWRSIVQDQLQTLYQCGLGPALSEWFVSYAMPRHLQEHHQPEKEPTRRRRQRLVQELQTLLIPPPSVPQSVTPPQLFASTGIPWEGSMLNQLIQYCQEIPQDKKATTLVFYWHTKGSSRWHQDWRARWQEPYTYGPVLYWRKYLEYFVLERPAHCIHRLMREGAQTCGVAHQAQSGIYAGNIWAATCSYLTQIPKVQIRTFNQPVMSNQTHSPSSQSYTAAKSWESGYFDAEQAFGIPQRQARQQQQELLKRNHTRPSRSSRNDLSHIYVSLHQPKQAQRRKRQAGFYAHALKPEEYRSAIADWGPLSV